LPWERRNQASEVPVLTEDVSAGIGKTELLNYLVGASSGCRILRDAGIQSEMELSYARLHQLCSPLLAESVALVFAVREPSGDGEEHPRARARRGCLEHSFGSGQRSEG
jgi:hypothetical protein